LDTAENLIDTIPSQRKDLTREQVQNLIEEKKRECLSLLSEWGAVRLVADELLPRVEIEPDPSITAGNVALTNREGTLRLADLQITESELILVPNSHIKYQVDSPPLKAFLVHRILKPMHAEDVEGTRTGQLSEEKILAYELIDERGTFKSLRVCNYGDLKSSQSSEMPCDGPSSECTSTPSRRDNFVSHS